MISFIGSGNYINNQYDKTEYKNFPNGKSYTSALFLNCFLKYCNEIEKSFDELHIVGTFSSFWGALLEELPQYKGLQEELIILQDALKDENDPKFEENVSVLSYKLEALSEILEKELKVTSVYCRPHYSEIDTPESITTIYNDAYYKLGKDISGNLEDVDITIDITSSLRWMPFLCNQALSESDMSVSHLVYGEKKGKLGFFRDLSESCKITKMNKALFAFSKLNLLPLSNELKGIWDEMSEAVRKLHCVLSYSIMDKCREVCQEFYFLANNMENYSEKINAFDHFKETIVEFSKLLFKDTGIDNISEEDLSIIYILNCSEIFIQQNMFTQSALATEAALQLFIMGLIYGEECNWNYDSFNKEYLDRIHSFNGKKLTHFIKIKKDRNAFAHGFEEYSKSELNSKKMRLSSNADFLRKCILEKYN